MFQCSSLRRLAIVLASCAAVACGTPATPGTADDSVAGEDTAVDAGADAADVSVSSDVDVGSPDVVGSDAVDVAPDVAEDVAPDVGPDAAPDAAPDAQPDTPPDTQTDIQPDTTPDVAPDTAPDAAPDVSPDVSDIAPDVVIDVEGPDATDTQEAADADAAAGEDAEVQADTQDSATGDVQPDVPADPCLTLNCDDGNACTLDTCEAGVGCKNADLDGSSCSDGQVCSENDVCAGSTCTAGAPKACGDGGTCGEPSGCACLPTFVGTAPTCACPTGYAQLSVDATPLCAPDFPAWGMAASQWTDNGDGTATDATTGLQWEVTPSTDTFSRTEARAHCDGVVLGGFSDWRMPTVAELLTLVDYAKTGPAASAPFANAASAGYWADVTANINAGTTSNYEVEFTHGASRLNKKTPDLVRCVRQAVPLASPQSLDGRYVVNAAGDAVLDKLAGVVWQRDPQATNFVFWGTANVFCTLKSKAGTNPWRLPTLRELQSIVLRQVVGAPIDLAVFPNTQTTTYWAANASANGLGNWTVDFSPGPDTIGVTAFDEARTRCVHNADCAVAADCNDGSICTTDTCDAGTCVNASALNCDDGVACSVDSCDPTAGCKHDTSACVTYADVQPIYASKCSGCHTGGGSGGHDIGTTFADALLSSYYCSGKKKGECTIVRIQDGTMPQGGGCSGNPTTDANKPQCLTQAEQDKIAQWILDGLLQK